MMITSSALFARDNTQEIEAFVLANVRFTIIHELSHAVIDILEVPVLGRLEDAADQMAMMAWMRPHAGHSNQIDDLVMATEAWRLEWALHEYMGHGVSYWSDHSLDIQRFYNLACLIAGSDPERMAQVQRALQLPFERAWFCEDEHHRSQRALEWVVKAHPPNSPNEWLNIVYEPPATSWRQRMHAAMQQRGTLDAIVERAEATIAMPQPPLKIVMANCGEPAAYWRTDLREIVFCNELLDRFKGLAEIRHCQVQTSVQALTEPMKQCIATTLGS